MKNKIRAAVVFAGVLNGGVALAAAGSFMNDYAAQARQTDATFSPSVERGKAFYHTEKQTPDGKLACAGCHTADPRGTGKTSAGKAIEPLAPGVNPQRFSDLKKTEKWFRRNCNDVFARECTPAEKADFIAYVSSIK